jgi:hypothetical protein
VLVELEWRVEGFWGPNPFEAMTVDGKMMCAEIRSHYLLGDACTPC